MYTPIGYVHTNRLIIDENKHRILILFLTFFLSVYERNTFRSYTFYVYYHSIPYMY